MTVNVYLNYSISLFSLVLIITFCSCCFITNCPPGGKRSLANSERQSRQCQRCGPRGEGRCFGPDICCGPTIGCYIRNSISAACMIEDYNPTPCKIKGKICSNDGICATDMICCNSESCHADQECSIKSLDELWPLDMVK